MKYEDRRVISYGNNVLQAHVVSSDTNNIMSHVIGVDFNSLYPSAFSSQYHPSNPYQGGKMYMPGLRMLSDLSILLRSQGRSNIDPFPIRPNIGR